MNAPSYEAVGNAYTVVVPVLTVELTLVNNANDDVVPIITLLAVTLNRRDWFPNHNNAPFSVRTYGIESPPVDPGDPDAYIWNPPETYVCSGAALEVVPQTRELV